MSMLSGYDLSFVPFLSLYSLLQTNSLVKYNSNFSRPAPIWLKKNTYWLTSLLKFMTLSLIWTLNAHQQLFQTANSFTLLLNLIAHLLFSFLQAQHFHPYLQFQRKLGHLERISKNSHDILLSESLPGSAIPVLCSLSCDHICVSVCQSQPPGPSFSHLLKDISPEILPVLPGIIRVFIYFVFTSLLNHYN